MKSEILPHIHSPADVKQCSPAELLLLANELREFIIDVVATKEGHLGASLGVVELTIALHYVFNTPEDQLIWDVGHQAYGHKILTGRRDLFHTNRKLNGISGFPKRAESVYDAFGVGHSSTSISAALGMAIAAQLSGNEERQHIAVIGDASIAAGMAFEGLNHAGVTDANLLVILNDNAIGIDPSVGALKNYLTKAKVGYKPRENNIIEALNFTYKGPIDGHDLPALIEALETLKQQKGPRFLHVITTKGKGLAKAEQDQVTYHAPGKFDKNTGEILKKTEENTPPKYQDVFGLTLVELAENNPKIIGITPAMPTGSSLKYMMQRFPERAFDVGIAEQHAVTFAAGLATQGYVVFCAIYSTFLQRAMDQVIHDVALQNLPVIFCIDRSGLVGNDGATHHGVFDIALLKSIPNMIIAAPSNEIELRNLLYTVSKGVQQPIAIRYPRGLGSNPHWQQKFEDVAIGKYQLLKEGNQLAIISVGHMRANVEEALLKLGNKEADVAHYAIQFIKPFQAGFFVSLFRQYSCLITIEDGCIKGGFGEEVSAFAQQYAFQGKIIHLGIPDEFIEQGSSKELYELVGLSASQIAAVIQDCLK